MCGFIRKRPRGQAPCVQHCLSCSCITESNKALTFTTSELLNKCLAQWVFQIEYNTKSRHDLFFFLNQIHCLNFLWRVCCANSHVGKMHSDRLHHRGQQRRGQEKGFGRFLQYSKNRNAQDIEIT